MKVSRRRSAPRADLLTPLDVTNLLVEARGVPMHVAALALLVGGPLLDAAGELRLDAVRQHVGARLPRRLHQRLVVPTRGTPFWASPEPVDLAAHVRTRALPFPGDEAALLDACGLINAQPLDRRFPLWDMWLFTGLAGDRVGLLIRLHHAIADGIATLALLTSLFDQVSATAPPVSTESSHAVALESRRTVRDGSAATPRGVGPAPVGPGPGPGSGLVAGSRTTWAGARVALGRAGQVASLLASGTAPSASFNRPVSGRSQVILARSDLARVKEVAHAHGGKVNDVVLAAVAGGARRLLEARGEATDHLVLRVSVIASLRPPAADVDPPGASAVRPSGNLTGVRVVPVPVGEADPMRRLEQIASSTALQRSAPPLQPGGRLLRRWMVGMMYRQRVVNLLVSNLPGPPAPLSFSGAPVLELFQLGTNQGNLAISVSVLSYAGALEIAVTADATVVPDAAVFAEGLTSTLARLGVG